MPDEGSKLLRSLFLPAAASYKQCGWCPPVDIYEVPRGWLLKFDCAGVRASDVEVSVRQNEVVIRGVRRDVAIEQGQRSYSMEITYDRFERSVGLPADLAGYEAHTDYRDGMLIVRLVKES